MAILNFRRGSNPHPYGPDRIPGTRDDPDLTLHKGETLRGGYDRYARGDFSSDRKKLRRIPQGNFSNSLLGANFMQPIMMALRGMQEVQNRMPQQQEPDIWSQLEGLQDPSRYLMDPSQLEAQAHAAANAQYNPLIRALLEEQASSKRRAGSNKQEVGRMFGALERDLRGEVPDIREMYDETQKRTGNEYKDLEREIQGSYKKTQQDQVEMMKQLGIQAAAPDVLPEQQSDRDYFVNDARKEARTMNSALEMEENADVDFTKQGARIARGEGVSRRADIDMQLEDILAALGSQISGHRSARSAAYQSGLGQLQQQNQEFAYGQSQRDFDNFLKSMRLKNDFANDEMKRSQMMQGDSQSDPVKTYADIGGAVINRYGLPPQSGVRIYDAIMNSPTRNNPLEYGEPKQPAQVTISAVVEEAKRSGLNPNEIRALREILAELEGIR